MASICKKGPKRRPPGVSGATRAWGPQRLLSLPPTASQQSWLSRNGRVASRAKGGTMPTRGRQLWLQLQKSFRRAVEKIKNEEMKLAHLSHGLQRMGRITLLHPVRHVTHDCLKKVFVVLDTESSLHLYKEDGFYVSSRRGPMAMMGLLYATQADHFVAWHEGGLWVLDSGFKVLSEVQSALPISCGLYSQLLNRIVTAGQGNLAIWAFRGGYRSLHCCVTVSEGLGPGDVFSHLALDTSRTEPQRCFASCDTGAAAFDLSRGTLISFKTKLHSRTITDIVYCEVVGSPVTASRDTTIKVWDETWHIRTVFVGHTVLSLDKPGQLLAVSPSSSLACPFLVPPRGRSVPWQGSCTCWSRWKNNSQPLGGSYWAMAGMALCRRAQLAIPEPSKRWLEVPQLGPCAGTQRLQGMADKSKKRRTSLGLPGVVVVVRSAELAELEIRNRDLLLLQKGSVCAAKKVRPTKATRAEAFELYLRLFYKQQPKVKIPEEDFFDADEVLEAIGRCGSISELYGPNPSNMFLGAFPQLASLKAASEQLKDAGSSVGKGLVVSSTTISATPLPGGREASLQLVQGEKKTSIQAEAAWLKPAPAAPSLPETQESLLLLQGLVPLAASPEALASSEKEAPRSPASSSATAPSSEERFLETWQKRRRQSSLPPEDKPEPPKPRSLPASLVASSILSATVDASKSEKSLSREEPALSKASRETHKHSKSSLHSRSQISSEVVKGFFPQPSLSRDKTQSQTEPTGPLLPKLSSGFIPNSVVTQRLHIAELPSSAEALERVREAQEEPQRGSSVKTAVQDQQPGTEPSTEKLIHLSWSGTVESATSVFLTQLSESQYSLTEAKTEEDISAFYSCFKDADWFKQLFPKRCPPGMGQIEFLARLLAAMPTADFGTKTQLLEAILSLEEALGPDMRDMVFSTLIGLLNMKNGAPSMQEESEQRFILAALRALLILDKDSRDLMVELMSYYLQAPPLSRFAIEGLMEEVGVLDPHRYFYEEMDSWQVEEGSPKEEVRKVCSLWLEGAMQEFQEHRTLKHKPPPRHSCPHSPKAKVTHPRWRDTRSVRPVDAINHFAEKQLERQLADEVAELQEMPKDAVMVLPRIQKRQAILRLGETNAMLRNRIPEHGGFYFPYIIPRYFLKGFVPFVKLPLPKINLNPFPSRPERLVSPKTFTEKQQSVQKYFIPKFSYADSYP
ncbi:WD repeat-containing protein 97 [Sphaerodactylus townsendi]|uniref:WD repeat-containing protein 97 n=1 Tax=Sphaerodactylus townsendi TaxID=933632 RepID=UPI002025E378|nr:WD repeat-containing protein 97 [Sphaerodactylus townsendi]